MAFTISDDCMNCGACAENCPTDSIIAGPVHMEINLETCIECGLCAEGCVVDAIRNE